MRCFTLPQCGAVRYKVLVMASKGQVLRVTRLKIPIETKYFLLDTMLDSVSSAKYLGVTVSDDLSWSTRIDNITRSANQTLGFLTRNIRVHNKDLKSVAYKTLVRPQLEYASTVPPPPSPPPPPHTHCY